MKNFRIFPLFALLLFSSAVQAQSLTTGQELQYNPISTAVPFLTITPDSRHGGMGDVGAATSPDANSQYLNPAKYAFAEGDWGFSLSYTPWLHQLVKDVNLAYLAGYYRIDQAQVIGTSLRYFSMGQITLTGVDQTNMGTFSPSELAYDVSYNRLLSEEFSGGVALRYIRSDLSGGFASTQAGAETYSAGNAVATDVSFYYHHAIPNPYTNHTISMGVNLSNIGSKISYNQGSTKEFLPANLRLGSTYTTNYNDSSSLSFSVDLNKLMVPTPANSVTYASDGTAVVVPNNNSNKAVISSIFSSFTDAPGGMAEELKEVTVSLGAEYWYKKQFAVRAGYFNESQMKGNRKFFTAGVGLKMNFVDIDFSYLVPTQRNNPLANTIRFSLLFDVQSFVKKKKSVLN